MSTEDAVLYRVACNQLGDCWAWTPLLMPTMQTATVDTLLWNEGLDTCRAICHTDMILGKADSDG